MAELAAREREGVRLAEQGDLDGALARFSALIAEAPEYASAYNNRCARARARRGAASWIRATADAVVVRAPRCWPGAAP